MPTQHLRSEWVKNIYTHLFSQASVSLSFFCYKFSYERFFLSSVQGPHYSSSVCVSLSLLDEPCASPWSTQGSDKSVSNCSFFLLISLHFFGGGMELCFLLFISICNRCNKNGRPDNLVV